MKLQLIQELPKSQRMDEDKPQRNEIDEHGVQIIELNRGCKRGCAFCWADPNMKFFEVPEITRNFVQIQGEGILYDPNIKEKIIELGKKRVNGKVVYYGLYQGFDFRLIDKEMAKLFCKNRIWIINSKGKKYKGIRFAWDGGINHEQLAKDTIEMLVSAGFRRKQIQVFCLTLWKFPYELCEYKRKKLFEWGVKIDDCTWNTSKGILLTEKRKGIAWHNPYWTRKEYEQFRRDCRKHNHLINFDGHDPEAKW